LRRWDSAPLFTWAVVGESGAALLADLELPLDAAGAVDDNFFGFALFDRTYGHLAPDAEDYERGLLDAFDKNNATEAAGCRPL
jgi:hypothetical protein